jgi:hypothetical protein
MSPRAQRGPGCERLREGPSEIGQLSSESDRRIDTRSVGAKLPKDPDISGRAGSSGIPRST